MTHSSSDQKGVDVSVPELPADSHLRLGITEQGLVDVLRLTNFPFQGVCDHDAVTTTAAAKWAEGLDPFPGSYTRGPKEAKYATSAQLTGYDLCAAVRSYLAETGNDALSMCEVMKRKDDEQAKQVNSANIFLSHMQGLPLEHLLRTMRNAHVMYFIFMHKKGTIFWWVDYACLRQSQRDFTMPLVRALITEIGETVAEADVECQYFTRSFCLLEALATIGEKGDYEKFHIMSSSADPKAPVCYDRKAFNPGDGDANIFMLGAGNGKTKSGKALDSASAQTRDEEDKHTIDEYIRTSVGFKELDDCMSAATKRMVVERMTPHGDESFSLDERKALILAATKAC